MRKIFFLIFLYATMMIVCGTAFANDANEEAEYTAIFFNYLKAEKGANSYNRDVKKLTIDKYIRFIDKYPTSKFVPEAMLKIAEFYDVIDQTQLAKKWLDVIIDIYPSANYYKLKVHYTYIGDDYSFIFFLLTQEKTAGWALYYRAMWFPGKNEENRKADIERILKDYKSNKRTIKLIQNR